MQEPKDFDNPGNIQGWPVHVESRVRDAWGVHYVHDRRWCFGVTWFESPTALCPSNWPQDIADWYSPANDERRAQTLKEFTDLAELRQAANDQRREADEAARETAEALRRDLNV